jgi:hypothetical protein
VRRPVLIAEHVADEMKQMAAAALPFETGGILVGVKARRSIWVVGAIELADERSSGHYTVPRGATKPAVRSARDTIDPRVGYAGEWHTNTADFGPRATDRASMRAISWFVPHPGPGVPCFLLVRNSPDGWSIHGYRARFPQLFSVPFSSRGQ